MRTEAPARGPGAALALGLCLAAGEAVAHSGGVDPGCWATLDTLRYEVTAWQPASSDARMFCRRLPATGATVLVFDRVDAALARLPVELALWPRPEAGYAASLWQDPGAAARRVTHLPAAVRGDGALVVRHAFAAGRYVAALRARRADGTTLLGEFSFEVGVAAGEQGRFVAIALGLPLLLGAALTIDERRRAPAPPAQGESP